MESSKTVASIEKPNEKISTIEEVGIVLAAKDLTPMMASHDFLKVSGIVPQEWELSQQPIQNPNSTQLSYSNGVNITAQPRAITFSETLTNKEADSIVISRVASRYINKLPHADYLGISCTPKILIPYPSNPDGVRDFITKRLLGSGSWKNIGNASVQAGINLMYYLERCQLTISIAEAKLQQPQQPSLAAILFSGSFNYNIDRDLTGANRMNQIKQILQYWEQDLSEFRDIVANKFMEIPEATGTIGEGSLFPSL